MENNRCVVTCAFREPYVTHHNNQIKLIKEPVISFVDCLPYGEGVVRSGVVERFQRSLYGFKPWAVKRALDEGYTKIIWFDPSVLPVDSVTSLFDELDNHSMLIRPGANTLDQMTSLNALNWFGVSMETARTLKHIGGTIYGFNFDMPRTRECFDLWLKAEQEGIFGDQEAFMNGHWADESCMSLAMFKTGVEFVATNFKYKNQKEC